jgi:DNA-binding beta-propeller fold protein YncE
MLFVLILVVPAGGVADVAVRTVDFAPAVNAAGPQIVQVDEARNRLIVANTLTSSLTIYDCSTGRLENIPVGGRSLQHLKAEAMTICAETGDVCLVGANCIYVVSPDDGSARTISTEHQFESVAVDCGTGNVFVAGRESADLGMVKRGSKKLTKRDWLETSEPLINLNATPPPPVRKVIADNGLGRIIAVDGMDPALYVFDARKGKLLESRPLPLEAGGRWHLAGYNEDRHSLYLVIEKSDRKVVQAARIDITGGNDVVVPLPGFTEGVGIVYNPAREEVYVPYDNHPSVHAVGFENGGEVTEIRLPAYGNDAAAVDAARDRLYIGSWAYGEIDVVDLETKMLEKRITDLGIIPHMFAIAFNPGNGRIYYPTGASAVNGTFGAAVTALDPVYEKTEKIYTGWAPIDLIAMPERGTVVVFNSEDQFAEVRPDGSFDLHDLPYDWPVSCVRNREGDIYLSYGPHQSYWPTVYIWGARNGVLTVDADDFSYYDRRIPRQAHRMVLDSDGVAYFTQNNWGKEEQFLGTLRDPVRVYQANERVRLTDEVQRETTQRILEYDAETDRLYVARIGENDDEPGVLQVVDPVERKVLGRIEVGLTPTDLVFDDTRIYVSNFDSRSVSLIDRFSFEQTTIETAEQPLALCRAGGRVYVVCHSGKRLQDLSPDGKSYKAPHKALPDNVFEWNGRPVVTSHNDKTLYIDRFDPERGRFETLHEVEYPFGDTRFDSRNVSFYVRGQYGDAVFEITRAVEDGDGRLWVTDFLSGKLFILE